MASKRLMDPCLNMCAVSVNEPVLSEDTSKTTLGQTKVLKLAWEIAHDSKGLIKAHGGTRDAEIEKVAH